MEELKEINRFFKRYHLLAKQKGRFLGVLVLSFLSIGITMILPRVTEKIVDDGLISININTVIFGCICYSLLFIVQILIDYVKENIRINIYLEIKNELNIMAMTRLWKTKYENFHKNKTAEIINDISFDAEIIASVYDNEMLFGFTQLFNIIGGIIGLALINFKMMIAILAFLPIKILLVKRFSEENKKMSDEYITLSEQCAGFEADSLDGIKEIKIYNLFSIFEKKLKKILGATISKEKVLHVLPQKNVAVDNFIAQAVVIFIYLVGAMGIMHQNMSVGTIVAFITYSSYVIGPISTILNIKYKISGIIPSEKRFEKLLKMEAEGSNNIDKLKIPFSNVIFKDVNFSYAEGKRILTNLSIELKINKLNVIIGNNGCGKTTFVNMILRFFYPDNGEILIGTTSINKKELSSYRENIAFVAQEPFIFCDSIKNNLTLFRKIDTEKIIKVCRKCDLMDFINDVSFDYQVGERGMRLSGGQRQKIAIARAILSERKYIILDEALSNIDMDGKKHIVDMLDDLKQTHMIIMVTHDKDIINRADNIVHL